MSTIARIGGALGVIVLAGGLWAQSATAQTSAPARGATPTFSKEVLPILQRSCQKCHRPDS